MSYILDALKKSESERQQGRVPDLGQQIRMIHRNRKRSIPVAVWLALALVINALVLLVVFWPESGLFPMGASVEEPAAADLQTATAEPVREAADLPGQPVADFPAQASGEPVAEASGSGNPVAPVSAPERTELPLVIHPSSRFTDSLADDSPSVIPEPFTGRVPHLVEMPMAFQRQVPDLVFNSHVYASNPADRRVMINNRLLRAGETFSNLKIERITEEGVELSMEGQRFRVGVVRDWSSPR